MGRPRKRPGIRFTLLSNIHRAVRAVFLESFFDCAIPIFKTSQQLPLTLGIRLNSDGAIAVWTSPASSLTSKHLSSAQWLFCCSKTYQAFLIKSFSPSLLLEDSLYCSCHSSKAFPHHPSSRYLLSPCPGLSAPLTPRHLRPRPGRHEFKDCPAPSSHTLPIGQGVPKAKTMYLPRAHTFEPGFSLGSRVTREARAYTHAHTRAYTYGSGERWREGSDAAPLWE